MGVHGCDVTKPGMFLARLPASRKVPGSDFCPDPELCETLRCLSNSDEENGELLQVYSHQIKIRLAREWYRWVGLNKDTL